MSENKRVFDVDVNRDAAKKASTLDEFKKLNPSIFDHLGDNENAAYEELFKEFGTPAPAIKPETAAPAVANS